ncbi:hypothetical protein [Cypionkella sp.]|uniref:hypothetical protein n=1 Tax=Cypionkella sp. TaxID=2811411 RepID=UPI0026017BBA|nr:hypothetical protein [Cypionkella sp.]
MNNSDSPPNRPLDSAEAQASSGRSPEGIVTSDALRHQLDHGAGSDKVSASDPAAAPLGTDDEAGGHPPTKEQLRMASAQEIRSAPKPSVDTRDVKVSKWIWAAGLFIVLVVLIYALSR